MYKATSVWGKGDQPVFTCLGRDEFGQPLYVTAVLSESMDEYPSSVNQAQCCYTSVIERELVFQSTAAVPSLSTRPLLYRYAPILMCRNRNIHCPLLRTNLFH